MPIEPDVKDWTWTVERACPDCGHDPRRVTPRSAAAAIRSQVTRWDTALARPDAAVRPNDTTWSALEYGAHVRDVLELFRERLIAMLETDGVRFANWDQDATALAKDYAHEDAARVAGQIAEQTELTAAAFEAVPDERLGHRGRRSNGSSFTVATLTTYFLHDVVHHLHDVGA